MTPQELNEDLARRARLRLLQMHFEAGAGHIGGNLSCLDILLSLFHGVMSEADAFVLSKGRSAGALYVTLWTLGAIADEELRTFHKDGTRLSGHPPANAIGEIRFATGSLGHGLGLAAGIALGRRFRNAPGHVYCLTSDGEWNEGSTWEALIFAKHHALDLTFVVDLNGLQGFGTTKEVADLEPLADKLRAFGVHTQEVGGHDLGRLRAALAPDGARRGPRAVIARTRKGCGVPFMEDTMEWHYLPLNAQQYESAVAGLSGSLR